MNDLQVFTDPAFGSIRTAVIDSEPWFVGKDVARAMGYKNPRDALNRHVDPEDRGASCFTTPYGDQSMTVINESGIYSLILSSKLPKARRFKHWVTSVVLPTIRRQGVYATEGALNAMIADTDVAVRFLVALKEGLDKRAARAAMVPQVPTVTPVRQDAPKAQAEALRTSHRGSLYQDCMEDILSFTGGKRVLTLDDVRRYTGMVDDRTLKRHFPFQGRIISAPALARFMAGETEAM